jgi:hypothetical protein
MWRFADYQDSTALWLHITALWIDLYFVSKARIAFAVNAAGTDTENKGMAHLFSVTQLIRAPVTASPSSPFAAL